MRFGMGLAAAFVASVALGTPAAYADKGLTLTPPAGYLDTAVEVRSTTTPCPEGSTKATLSLWVTSAEGKGTGATVTVAASGAWVYRGAFFAPVTPGRYWFVVNCYNADNDGVMTYEPGWSFTVDSDSYNLAGHDAPPPRPRPTTLSPTARPPATPAPTRPPVVTRTPAPTRTPLPTRRPTAAVTTPPATTPPATTPPVTTPPAVATAAPLVPITATGPGNGPLVAVGAGAAGLLAAAAGVVLVRRRRAG